MKSKLRFFLPLLFCAFISSQCCEDMPVADCSICADPEVIIDATNRSVRPADECPSLYLMTGGLDSDDKIDDIEDPLLFGINLPPDALDPDEPYGVLRAGKNIFHDCPDTFGDGDSTEINLGTNIVIAIGPDHALLEDFINITIHNISFSDAQAMYDDFVTDTDANSFTIENSYGYRSTIIETDTAQVIRVGYYGQQRFRNKVRVSR